jgi:alpha-D-xyloside xylohydrolase
MDRSICRNSREAGPLGGDFNFSGPLHHGKVRCTKGLDVSRPYRRILGVSAASVLLFAAAGPRFYAQPQVEPETRDAHGVSVRTGAFVTHVELWSDNIVRVQHRPVEAAALAPSLSVIATPDAVTWQTGQAGGELLLTTSKLEIHVDRHNGCVRIEDLAHHSVLDERCEATWINAAAVGSAANTLTSGQRFTLDPDESLFGLGQHPSLNTLNLVGASVRLLQRNGDVGIPVLLSSKGYLLLWDNPAITNIDIGKTDPGSVAWQSEAGSGVDYYVVAGSRPDDAIAGYRWLTGSAPMFPRWSWGFWQSRERYKTQDEILQVAGEYRKRHIPLDAIIQDWQYWPPLDQATAQGGWGSHEFDPSRYPNPSAMVDQLHQMNVHFMIVSWAKFDVTDKGVSIPNLQKLEAVHGAFNPPISYVFPPGRGKWYDPFNPQARKIYWDLLSSHLFHLGVDAWWLDAPEPELSGKWGEFRDFRTYLGSGALVFNAYPLEHTRSMYEGQRGETDAKRVVLLTRSAYAGQQRNGAITWSGDIRSDWRVLRQQVPAGLNFVASGIPYWNTDTGGFFGNDPDNPKYVELFTRWFQFGSFCPMFRVHGTDKPKEVWRFDAATQQILIKYLNLRYHLLPYIYTVSWQVTHDGYTMMRPLVMDFPQDKEARNTPDEFMFGPALLVSPVTEAGASSRPVRLPAGSSWIDFWTGKPASGGETITAAAPIDTMPIFVRAGSILPYGPTVEYASQALDAPIELRIYPGADGSFTLYDDAGDSYAYEKGDYSTIPLRWSDKDATLTIGARQGSFPGMQNDRTFRVVLVAPGHGSGQDPAVTADQTVHYTGKEISLHLRTGR